MRFRHDVGRLAFLIVFLGGGPLQDKTIWVGAEKSVNHPDRKQEIRIAACQHRAGENSIEKRRTISDRGSMAKTCIKRLSPTVLNEMAFSGVMLCATTGRMASIPPTLSRMQWNSHKRRISIIGSDEPSDYFASWLRLSGGAEDDGDTMSNVDEADISRSGAFVGNLDNLARRSLKLSDTFIQGKDPIIQRMKSAAEVMQQTGSRALPSAMTTITVLYAANRGISVASLYALALLGASCGFHLFLYFITIGYTLGIGLPLSVALYVYNVSSFAKIVFDHSEIKPSRSDTLTQPARLFGYQKHTRLPRTTLLHSWITLMWSARMLAFFIYREYVSWPALHEKVVEIQNRMTIPFASRLLCWLVYSFFYLAMMSMTWSRLHQGETAKWGLVGMTGLLLQFGGLILESIADLQKNGFKSRNRHSWCHVGVWKWSTHPNYLGEGTFWIGTYLGHGFSSVPRTILATTGLIFILQVLRGSTKSLARKHVEKYGDQPEFFEFYRTHSIWGPKHWWWWLHGMEENSKDSTNPVPAPLPTMDNTTISGNVTAATDTDTILVEDLPAPTNVQ